MSRLVPILLLLATGAACAQDDAPAPPAARPMNADECAVWERERSFAQTVARHDAAAFASHLHPGAVFIAGEARYANGREGVTQAWTGIIEGRNGVLHWHPRWVVIGGDPDIALSRGPWWMENPDPKAAQPWLTGQFISTWVRGEDGEWLVLFDGGGGNAPTPASEADIAALTASLPTACPSS